MLKRLRAKHPVGFCVLSEVLFLGSLLLASYLIVFALVLFGVDLERVDSYFLSAVQEAVGMVVALVILGRTGKMYLLRRRGSGFFNGLLVGMYPLVLIGYSLYTKLMFGMPEDGQLQPAFSIFSFFLSMALVGGLYGTEDVAESISGYDASMMLSILIYLIPTLFLLRKKKIGEVALYFGRDCAPAAAPAPEENGERLR